MTIKERIEVDLTLKVGVDFDPHDGVGSAINKTIYRLGDMSMFVTVASAITCGGTGGILSSIDTPGRIKRLIKWGLNCDGGHHKQWYLEQILEMLGYNIEDTRKEIEKEGYYAEKGVVP